MVDTKPSVMKELGVKWLTSTYNYICSHKDIVINGFHKAGIEMPSDNSGGDNADPFADLD